MNVADASPGGRSDWLARELRRAIADGRLPVGSRLPATRTLAADLRVSRGVVTEAYQRLTEDGQLAGRGRGGTVVVAAPVTVATPDTSITATRATTAGTATGPTTAGTATGPTTAGTATTAATTPPYVSDPAAPVPPHPFAAPPGPEIFDELRAAPARIDLSPGVPDLAAFPRAAWLRAERAVLADLPAAGMGYGDPRGTPALRQAVAHWLARNRGIRVDPDEVLIVAGTSQALGLIAQVLHRDGDPAIAVEDPGSLGVRQHLQYWQVATPPIPVDDDGLCVDALRASGARAVLLTPAHQFPTGVVLGGHRRRELMHWASAGGLIVEDDYDAEHRYDRAPVPALRSLLPDQVCYVGTVSKLLAPALRVGWLLAPSRYHSWCWPA
ncbi:PLP-dependent aminotransferase family protein [Streptomyces sioyaensis]|uniref:PLP-dependent aminotransferase family protein n=1 Tax=Streptomyces sioyaensis TaxID=67364 RepID=UPI0037A9D560